MFFSIVILINSYIKPDEVPSFFGWKPFIVLSGSMETEIQSGDIVVVKEVDVSKIKKNDIIAFKENNIVITHRVVDILEEDGIIKYKTKGDNNNIEDNGYVLSKQIEGIYQFKIKGLGNLAIFIQTPIGMIVCLSIPIILLVIIQALDSHKNKKQHNEAKMKEKELQERIIYLERKNKELENKGGNNEKTN